MAELIELIRQELADKDKVRIPVQKLVDAQTLNVKYETLRVGPSNPEIGVYNPEMFSGKEFKSIHGMLAASEQSKAERDLFEKFTYENEVPIEHYRAAFEVVENMRQGDISKINLNNQTFYVAAFPHSHLKSQSIVVFVDADRQLSIGKKIVDYLASMLN